MLLSPANLTYSELNNVHVGEGDFSQVESITHTGALVIGTYDNSSRNGAYKNMNSIAPKNSTIEKLRIAF